MPEIFRLEAEQLTKVAMGLTAREWNRPTACPPWSVRELLSHVRVVIAWLPGMLMGERPLRADVSAADYYRADGRFDPETNARRISLAQAHSARLASGDALVRDFEATWRRVYDLCRHEPSDRIVRTRHDDAMFLSDFLLTRVVELAVHGLDLAAALDRDAWLTPEAGGAVAELLLGPEGAARIRELGWDQVSFLRLATGRDEISAAQVKQFDDLSIRWLSLG
jgi:uncharacterized protein (TIGR03083 family)